MSQLSNFSLAQVREHQNNLWKGEIPVQFDIHPSEAIQHSFLQANDSSMSDHSMKIPSFFKMLSRINYLGIYLEEITQYFRPFVRHQDSDGVWLEYNGEPLKWNAPIGVLYDYLCSWYDEQRHTTLPWRITVRFFAFPRDRIPELQNDEDFQWNFINNLKESFFVQYNNTTAIMTNLTKVQQQEMWQSIKSMEFGIFDSSFNQMMDGYLRYENSSRKRIPVKIYRVNSDPLEIKNTNDNEQQYQHSGAQGNIASELCCIDNEFALKHSLYDFLSDNIYGIEIKIIEKIVIQGIGFEFNNDTVLNTLKSLSIIDAYNSFCHPDQHLYITIVENPALYPQTTFDPIDETNTIDRTIDN